MGLTWNNFLAIVFVAVALFLLAAVPAAEASEEPGFTTVDDSTELIATTAIDTDAAHFEIKGSERLPASPGGDYAIGGGSSNDKVTTCKMTNSKVTENAKEVLPGGAAGAAANGIRGPINA